MPRLILALCATLALPLASVAADRAGTVATPSIPVPGLGTAGGKITAVAMIPTCPQGFEVSQSSSTLYECIDYVPQNQAAGFAFVAQQKPCEFPGYWNNGPTVTITPVREAARIKWVCKHF